MTMPPDAITHEMNFLHECPIAVLGDGRDSENLRRAFSMEIYKFKGLLQAGLYRGRVKNFQLDP